MANLWQKLTYHRGNGWWNLPHTASQEPDPPFEGPIGGAWLSNIWRTITHGGVSHAGPGFYWLVGLDRLVSRPNLIILKRSQTKSDTTSCVMLFTSMYHS